VEKLSDHLPIIQSFRNKIKLDVGGVMFCTTMEVLTRCNSYFSSLFEDAQQDPYDGSYFVDRSPQYFDLVLEFLRYGSIRSIKKLDKDDKAGLLADAEYYALADLVNILSGAGKADVDGMCWDPQKRSSGVTLNDTNNMTAGSNGSCSHKTVLSNIPITCGVVSWEIYLNQTADCYSAAGIVGESFGYGSNDRIGISPNSWGLGFYPGSHCDTSDRRIQATSRLNSGQVVKSIYDADEHTLKMSVDGIERAKYKNVNLENAYLAVTVCCSASGGYTLRNVEAL